MKASALHEVMRFVGVQRALLAALRMRVGAASPLSALLSAMPPTGNVEAAGAVWDYVRHGSGVRFRERGSGRTIDVPERIDEPEVFDLWRLRTYFGSLGAKGTRMLNRSVELRGAAVEEALTVLLGEWRASGSVIEDGDAFRFARPILEYS